jgi:hypothetical protein
MEYSYVPVSKSEIFANKEAADEFEEVNRLREKRRPAISRKTPSPQGRYSERSIGRATLS